MYKRGRFRRKFWGGTGPEQRRCPPLSAAYLSGPEQHRDFGGLRFRAPAEESKSGSRRRQYNTALRTRRLFVGGTRSHANVLGGRASRNTTAFERKGSRLWREPPNNVREFGSVLLAGG